jgi:hypothetical protein
VRKSLFPLLVAALFGWHNGHAQGKINGYMIGDFFYNLARDTTFRTGNLPNAAVGGQKDLQAFQFRRIYFSYDNDISETFTSRFRLEADQAALTSNGKIGVFVKDAYLKWKNVFDGSDLTFGLQPSSSFEISEAAWGYRSLEKTILDLRGITPSRELGISLRGRLNEEGTFNYWATFSNNGGTSVPNGTNADLDKFKRYSLNLQVKPLPILQATLYSSYLARPSVNDPGSISIPRATVNNSEWVNALFVGVSEKEKYSIGVEGFYATRFNHLIDTSTTPDSRKGLHAMGFTIFGSVDFNSSLAAVARYDFFDPNTDATSKGDIRHYILAGVNWRVDRNVMIMPNLMFEAYEKLPNGGPSFDPSVTGRVTFYYVFVESK